MTKIIQRHDTAANWTSVNPVLAAGEMGVETDTNKFKFGDGTTAWTSLAYASGEGSGSSGTTLTSIDGATTYSKLALGETLSVTDTSTKKLNKLTQTGGSLNSELEFTGASGASLKMTKKYSLSTADSWEFQIKYKHNGGGIYPAIFGYASGSDFKTPSLIYQDGTLVLYLSSSGGSWNLNLGGSGLSLVPSTIYYFKVGFTGSQYYIKYNTTGWTDEFTTQWTLNSTTKVYCSDYFMLMNLSLNSGYYNTGTMYLQDTALIINGVEVWRGANVIPSYMILNASPDAYTKTETDSLLSGKQDKLTAVSPIKIYNQYNLNVNNVDGSIIENIFQSTSNAGYLVSRQSLKLNTLNSWEFGLKIKYNIDTGNYRNRLVGGTGGYTHPTLEFDTNDNVLCGRISYNGSSWNNIPIPISNFAQNNIYYIKFGFSGTQYYIKMNTTGFSDEPTVQQTLSSTSKTYVADGVLSYFSGPGSTIYFGGDIYIDESYYMLNGVTTLFSSETLSIGSTTATSTSLGVVQPDGTSITVSETGIISGQDVKTFTGYSDTGTLVLKSINGVLQWVAE